MRRGRLMKYTEKAEAMRNRRRAGKLRGNKNLSNRAFVRVTEAVLNATERTHPDRFRKDRLTFVWR